VSWLSELGDELLADLIAHGYPALALTLLVSAVGLPLPSGLATVVAGALAAQGHLGWLQAGIVALAALGLGDTLGYGLGWLAGRELLYRYGRWIWLTPDRLRTAEEAFARRGGLSIVLSRSVLAPLSPAVNLLAGASRYRFGAFVPFALVGRVPWVSAYLGLGYCSSEHVEAAEEFLGSLGGLLGFLVILAGLVYLAWTRRGRRAVGPGGTPAGGMAAPAEDARDAPGGAAPAAP